MGIVINALKIAIVGIFMSAPLYAAGVKNFSEADRFGPTITDESWVCERMMSHYFEFTKNLAPDGYIPYINYEINTRNQLILEGDRDGLAYLSTLVHTITLHYMMEDAGVPKYDRPKFVGLMCRMGFQEIG